MPTDPPSSSESAEPLGPEVWIARDDLRFTFVRASGPGGQSVNKVSTAAQLRVQVAAIRGLNERAAARLRRQAGARLIEEADELLIRCETHRSQVRNREGAIERLREMIAKALPEPKVRKKKKPTRAMKERRLKAKREQAERKQRRNYRDD